MPRPVKNAVMFCGVWVMVRKYPKHSAPISTVNTAAAVRVACSSDCRMPALVSLPRSTPMMKGPPARAAPASGQLAPEHADDEGADRPARPGLGRNEEAAIEAADHKQKQQ